MKKKLCKWLSFGLAGLLLFTGCATGVKENSTPQESSSAPLKSETSTTEAGGETQYRIVEEPITLTVLTSPRVDYVISEEQPVLKEVQRLTNINLEYTLLPADAASAKEKFNLIMASNDLPNIVDYGVDRDLMLKYSMEGAFISLQDLIEEHGPNIKSAFENPLPNDTLPYVPQPWPGVTAEDGNVYMIPLLSASNSIGQIYAIREDWLAAVGMEVPTTSDELYEVLKAFKEQDPNGNGEADEIPFIAGSGGKTNAIVGLVNAFDAHIEMYIDKTDNIIKYGPSEAVYKDGLTFINKLYTDGLLDEDYLTDTHEIYLEKISNNKAGFMYLWPAGGLGGANTTLQAQDKSYKFAAIAPLKSPSGQQYKDTRHAGNAVVPRSAISATNPYPVETMKLFDFCMSEKGTELATWGIEGEHFEYINGVPEYTDLIINEPTGQDPEVARISRGIMWYGLPYAVGWDGNMSIMKKTGPWTAEAWEIYREPGIVEAPMPNMAFTSSELSEHNRLLADINTVRDQYLDKFILGIEPLSNFDTFVEELNSAGLPALLEIYNQAYSRQK